MGLCICTRYNQCGHSTLIGTRYTTTTCCVNLNSWVLFSSFSFKFKRLYCGHWVIPYFLRSFFENKKTSWMEIWFKSSSTGMMMIVVVSPSSPYRGHHDESRYIGKEIVYPFYESDKWFYSIHINPKIVETMKLPSYFITSSLTTKKPSNRSKKIASSIAILSIFLLFNFTYNSEAIKRQLSDDSEIPKVMSRQEVSEEDSFLSRYLSENLGGGRCKWTAPEELDENDNSQTTTLLASYPGSGKRLV